MRKRTAAVVISLAVLACDERSEADPGSQSSPPAAASARAPAAESWRLPAPERIVAFGDVHGDLAATRRALRLAGAIDAGDRWVGGKLVVVQTGDQLDRGDQEREILDLFDRLMDEAQRAGGAFHPLNGNHETMNVLADFRYVTSVGFSQFADVQPPTDRAGVLQRLLPEVRGRAAAFLPGGTYARKLARRRVVLMVGDTVFVHGGVLHKHVAAGIERLNDETARWMRGERSSPPSLVERSDGPLWTRAYGAPGPGPEACTELDRTLEALAAKRMVVGHCVQDGGVSAACGDKAWRIDIGLAAHYGSRPPELLEITAAGVRVMRQPGEATEKNLQQAAGAKRRPRQPAASP
jgi:hypothetical protein